MTSPSRRPQLPIATNTTLLPRGSARSSLLPVLSISAFTLTRTRTSPILLLPHQTHSPNPVRTHAPILSHLNYPPINLPKLSLLLILPTFSTSFSTRHSNFQIHWNLISIADVLLHPILLSASSHLGVCTPPPLPIRTIKNQLECSYIPTTVAFHHRDETSHIHAIMNNKIFDNTSRYVDFLQSHHTIKFNSLTQCHPDESTLSLPFTYYVSPRSQRWVKPSDSGSIATKSFLYNKL